MDKKEYFKKNKDVILKHEFRILKKYNKQLIEEGVKLYKSEKRLSQAIRDFRRKCVESEVTTQLTPNSAVIKKERVIKTKAKLLDIKPMLDGKTVKYEVLSREEQETTETAKIDKITFHSDFSVQLFPLINQLIQEAKSYKVSMTEKHSADNDAIEQDIAESVSKWKKRVKPIEKAFDFLSGELIEKIELLKTEVPDESTVLAYKMVANTIDTLLKLADKLSRIEHTLMFKTKTKYEIRDMQSREIDTFIGSLVKLQLQIKGMVDNDVQMLQNGMVKKQAGEPEAAFIPQSIKELYKSTTVTNPI